ETADADAVLAAAGRVGDLVVAEDAVAAEVLDAEFALQAALAAEVDLFFAEHGWPSPAGNGRRGALGPRCIIPARRPGGDRGPGGPVSPRAGRRTRAACPWLSARSEFLPVLQPPSGGLPRSGSGPPFRAGAAGRPLSPS